jgi:hypothetical protein
MIAPCRFASRAAIDATCARLAGITDIEWTREAHQIRAGSNERFALFMIAAAHVNRQTSVSENQFGSFCRSLLVVYRIQCGRPRDPIATNVLMGRRHLTA